MLAYALIKKVKDHKQSSNTETQQPYNNNHTPSKPSAFSNPAYQNQNYQPQQQQQSPYQHVQYPEHTYQTSPAQAARPHLDNTQDYQAQAPQQVPVRMPFEEPAPAPRVCEACGGCGYQRNSRDLSEAVSPVEGNEMMARGDEIYL